MVGKTGTYARWSFFSFLIAVAAVTADNRALAAEEGEPFSVTVRVDADKSMGALRPTWRFFGGDEPNYVYMKDGEKLLSILGGSRPNDVYFRCHNLLTSGDGTPAFKWGSTNVYTEDADGNPIYDWTIVDRIFDTLLDRGVKPYVEVGFMPQALATDPEPYRHEWRPGFRYGDIYTGWCHPPKSYEAWGELIFQWAKHCGQRYGVEEVNSWYWETWNEANIAYWGGTRDEFFKLHDYTTGAVRRALPEARVGGPDCAGDGGGFTREFLEHCLRGENYETGEVGTPLDFISFHAKGAPRYRDDHVRMGIADQLRTIDRGFEIVASFPELRDTPIVIGESDPEGCAACQGPSFSYRNGTVYSSYTAASFAREHDLADKHGVNFDGALTWAFEFENQPYFAGFRQLASNGIPMPVLNVFRMFGRMSGDRVATNSSGQVSLKQILADGVRDQPDVGALASRDGDNVCVMLWHYHDDDVAGPTANVSLEIAGLDSAWSEAEVTHYRIDDEHSNSYAAWQRMGSPGAPNNRQYRRLLRASELATLGEPSTESVEEGTCTLEFPLPRQGVSLVVLSGK